MTLEKYILQVIAMPMAKEYLKTISALNTIVNLFGGLGYGLFTWAASGVIQNISALVDTILPIPFASGNIDPNINLYIDLDPLPSDYGLSTTMLPGIQAIEIMINCEKSSNGTSMRYNKKGSGYAALSTGDYDTDTTTSKDNSWDSWFLRIDPLNTQTDSTTGSRYTTEEKGMLAFDESAEVDTSKPSGQATVPTAIVINDPATRKGQMIGGAGADIELRDSAFFNSALFPQFVDVRFTAGSGSTYYHSYGTNPEYVKMARGTMLVWDASSVDLTPADSSVDYGNPYGKPAGYVYAYALNTVVYAIPVYITTGKDIQENGVKAYKFDSTTNSGTGKNIVIDINTNSSNFACSLPDLVQITFNEGGKRVFATVEEGVGSALVRLRNGNFASTKNADGSISYTTVPAYTVALERDEDGKVIYVDDPLGSSAKYAVVDITKLPMDPDYTTNPNKTGKLFPIGIITWDTKDFKYNWAGASDKTSSVTVSYSYSWGLSGTVTGTIEIPIVNNEIKTITSYKIGEEPVSALDKFDSFELTSTQANLINYINSINNVSGKTSGGKPFSLGVKWDLSNLKKAIKDITDKDGSVNYYKGIDVKVTAYIGGESFKITKGEIKNDLGIVISKYGFVGEGSQDALYVKNTSSGKAEPGYIAQPYEVRVCVKPYVFDSLPVKSPLVFDAYNSNTITNDTFSTSRQIIFNSTTLTKDGSNKVKVTKSMNENNLFISAPYIVRGGNYVLADSSRLKAEDITYNGYSGAKLYAKLTIGQYTEDTQGNRTYYAGKQEVYVPITINALTPQAKAMSVAHEDTFNPQWYATGNYTVQKTYGDKTVQVIENVSFGRGITHDMVPVWSTVKYYADSKKNREIANIWAGGTVYATVQAYVLDSEGNVVGCPKDKDGNDVYQTITLKLAVEKQKIVGYKTFFDPLGGGVDIYSSKNGTPYVEDPAHLVNLQNPSYYTGTVYSQMSADGLGLDPINYARRPHEYFRLGEWGDYVHGTSVLIEVTVDGEPSTPYIAFLQSVNYAYENKLDGTTGTLYGYVGGNEVRISIKTPSYVFTSFSLIPGESKTLVPSGINDAYAMQFEYDAFTSWKLPTKARFVTDSNISTTETIYWLDTSAPTLAELNVKVDGDRHYIERQYYYFKDTEFETEPYTARIYVTGYNETASTVDIDDFDDDNPTYVPFMPWSLPSTATVNGNKFGIPVVWDNYDAPSDAEIIAKKAIRTAYVGGNMWSQQFTIAISLAVTLTDEGFSGETGAWTYTLTADKFHQGLPRTGVVQIGSGTSLQNIPVSYYWDVEYDKNGFEGNVMLTISNDNISVEVPVALKVYGTTISEFVKDGMLVIDQYGKEGTFFTSGMNAAVKTASGDQVLVHGEYALPSDFYTNASKYFGKVLNIKVTFSFNGGKNITLTETLTESVYVLDRTVKYFTDNKYRTISIDPFIDNTIDSYLKRINGGVLPTTFGVTMFKDGKGVDNLGKPVYTSQNDYDVAIDWTGVSKLLKDQSTDFAYALPVVYTYTNDKGDEIKVTQKVVVPVVVANRVIDDTDFDPEYEGLSYSFLYTDESKSATITDTYISANGEHFQIVFANKAGSFPEQFIFENQFAYRGLDSLPQRIKFTFEDGASKYYRLTYDNVPTFEDISISTTTRRTIKLNVWSGDAETPIVDGDGRFIVRSLDIELVIRASKLSIYNTDIAYTDLSVGDYAHTFNPYADKDDSIFAKDAQGNFKNLPSEITYYVSGEFIKLEKWNNTGATIEKPYYRSDEWTRLHTIYNVLADNHGLMITYSYDPATRTHTKSDVGEYIFIYVTKQTLNVKWNNNDVEYTYKGGVVYAEATVSTKEANNLSEQTINVPIRFTNVKATEVTFAGVSQHSGYDLTHSFYDTDHNTFTINPYNTYVDGDYFARIPTYSGTRFAKQDDGSFKEDTKGTYKLVDGNYEELSYTELGHYKYFPSKAKITLGDGSELTITVEWDFTGVPVTYAGGNFTAIANINADGEFDIDRDNDTTNEVGVQKIKIAVKVIDGTVKDIADSSEAELLTKTGYINSSTYVDPYDFVEPTMPTTLTVKIVDPDNESNLIEKTYRQADDSLVWSFSTFRPSYKGGITKVTALLVGEDGNTQKYEINFKVYKMTVKNIESSSSYTWSSTVGVSKAGVADSDFTVNPYDGKTLKLPTSYNVTFETYAGTDKLADDDPVNSKSFSYVIVSMPTSLTFEVSGGVWTSEGDGKIATIQFSNQERIEVKLKLDSTTAISASTSITEISGAAVSGVTASTLTGQVGNSATTLPTTVKIGGKTMPVVWYGTAKVYINNNTTTKVAEYDVVLSSNGDTVTIPTIKGRVIVYTLRAAIGAVVDKNGQVVATKYEDVAKRYKRNADGSYVEDNVNGTYKKVGDNKYEPLDIIPAGLYVTGTKNVSVTG